LNFNFAVNHNAFTQFAGQVEHGFNLS
jgi:hypothetical protein